jgi:hypothetical protein
LIGNEENERINIQKVKEIASIFIEETEKEAMPKRIREWFERPYNLKAKRYAKNILIAQDKTLLSYIECLKELIVGI